MDCKDAKEMETDVQARAGGSSGFSYQEAGRNGGTTPRIYWNGDMRSRLEISASQPLDLVSIGVIQSEFGNEPN
jgi:hypothetical protein